MSAEPMITIRLVDGHVATHDISEEELGLVIQSLIAQPAAFIVLTSPGAMMLVNPRHVASITVSERPA